MLNWICRYGRRSLHSCRVLMEFLDFAEICGNSFQDVESSNDWQVFPGVSRKQWFIIAEKSLNYYFDLFFAWTTAETFQKMCWPIWETFSKRIRKCLLSPLRDLRSSTVREPFLRNFTSGMPTNFWVLLNAPESGCQSSEASKEQKATMDWHKTLENVQQKSLLLFGEIHLSNFLIKFVESCVFLKLLLTLRILISWNVWTSDCLKKKMTFWAEEIT